MRKFIELKRKSWACNDEIPFQFDIIRTDSIINVYIIQPDAKEICIIYIQNGMVYKRVERYKNPTVCMSRYKEFLEYMDVGKNAVLESLIEDPDSGEE